MRVAETVTRKTALTVGQRVKAEMGRQSIRQTAVAKRLGKSQQAVSRRLNGLIPFDVEELEIIAALLNVPATDFMAGAA